MDALTRTLYNIAVDIKIEERMEQRGNYVVEANIARRAELKRVFGLHSLWQMTISDIMHRLRTDPQKAKDIYLY